MLGVDCSRLGVVLEAFVNLGNCPSSKTQLKSGAFPHKVSIKASKEKRPSSVISTIGRDRHVTKSRVFLCLCVQIVVKMSLVFSRIVDWNDQNVHCMCRAIPP